MPGLASAAGMAFLSFLCFAGFLAFYFLIATYVLRRAGRRALLIFLPNLVIAFYASGMYHPSFYTLHLSIPAIFLYFLYSFVYGFVALFGYVAGIAYYVLLFALALYTAHAGQR